MEWINIFGAAFIAIIMVPNIIYALKCKDGFENKWKNKSVEMVEQIGRFGCFGKNTIFRALALSIIPSLVFLYSGIVSRSVLLMVSVVLFAPAHILISYKNAKGR